MLKTIGKGMHFGGVILEEPFLKNTSTIIFRVLPKDSFVPGKNVPKQEEYFFSAVSEHIWSIYFMHIKYNNMQMEA